MQQVGGPGTRAPAGAAVGAGGAAAAPSVVVLLELGLEADLVWRRLQMRTLTDGRGIQSICKQVFT